MAVDGSLLGSGTCKASLLLGGQYWRLEMPFAAVHGSEDGTFRTWRDVCCESVTGAEADIPCRYKLLHLASAIHRSVAPIATAHRPSAGCPRCRAFPTSQIAKNALDRASSTSNRCSWSP